MKCLTLNAGLLSISVLRGLIKVQPADWVEERLRALPDHLLMERPDILLLQEVYRTEHKDELKARLQTWLPYSAYGRERGRLRLLHDSLMILSTYPISDSGFVRFNAGRWDEKLLDTKGFYYAYLPDTSVGPVLVCNVHTTAGVFTHPEDPRVDDVRQQQLRQVIDFAESYPGEHSVLLGGDFNCGPAVAESELPISAIKLRKLHIPTDRRVSMRNYEMMAERGYTDSFSSLGLPEQATWSPTQNNLNVGGGHASWGCPPQRLDHFFYRRHELVPTQGAIIFASPLVRVDQDHFVPLSDHYGYYANLERAG